jgi:hypothetical protein
LGHLLSAHLFFKIRRYLGLESTEATEEWVLRAALLELREW